MTKHSIGNSRPSKSIKVKCPLPPKVIDEVYQIDTNQIGIILLTWQIPTRPTYNQPVDDNTNKNVQKNIKIKGMVLNCCYHLNNDKWLTQSSQKCDVTVKE